MTSKFHFTSFKMKLGEELRKKRTRCERDCLLDSNSSADERRRGHFLIKNKPVNLKLQLKLEEKTALSIYKEFEAFKRDNRINRLEKSNLSNKCWR
jgi:hypothetical protein